MAGVASGSPWGVAGLRSSAVGCRAAVRREVGPTPVGGGPLWMIHSLRTGAGTPQ
jgi:hypothetical protein